MISLAISLSLIIFTIVVYQHIKSFLQLLKIPGPKVPKGIKGNLPEFLAKPRECGPQMASKYGPLYRYKSTAP